MARACPYSGYQQQISQNSIASTTPIPYQLPPPQYPNTSHIGTQQGHGRGGRGFVRGSSQASTSQRDGREQPQIFALAQQNVQIPNVVEITHDVQRIIENE